MIFEPHFYKNRSNLIVFQILFKRFDDKSTAFFGFRILQRRWAAMLAFWRHSGLHSATVHLGPTEVMDRLTLMDKADGQQSISINRIAAGRSKWSYICRGISPSAVPGSAKKNLHPIFEVFTALYYLQNQKSKFEVI